MNEKRQHKRSPFYLETEVFKIAETQREEESSLHCKCRDISNGGLSFYSSRQYGKGDVVRVRIKLPESSVNQESGKNVDSISVLAKVMYSNMLAEEQCSVTGIQFLNIYQQDFDILCSFIVDRMSENKSFVATSSPLCLSKKSSVRQIK